MATSTSSTGAPRLIVPEAEMRRFVVDCMAAVGAERVKGEQVADLLILADRRGHYSHGLNRLRIYMEDCRAGNCAANAEPRILKQKGATAWVDGRNGLGAVVAHFCTDLAARLAREHGVGWVVCKGSNHYGIAGYWPLLLKQQGLIVGGGSRGGQGFIPEGLTPSSYVHGCHSDSMSRSTCSSRSYMFYGLYFDHPALPNDPLAGHVGHQHLAAGVPQPECGACAGHQPHLGGGAGRAGRRLRPGHGHLGRGAGQGECGVRPGDGTRHVQIELAERRGESMPSQWGADAQGHPTSDPVDVTQRDGALLPLGGTEETGKFGQIQVFSIS